MAPRKTKTPARNSSTGAGAGPAAGTSALAVVASLNAPQRPAHDAAAKQARAPSGPTRAERDTPHAHGAPTEAADGAAPRDGAPGAELSEVVSKKDLIARVVERSGAKKRDAKGVVEATLAILGEALADGNALNVPPLGKLSVNRQKDIARGEVLIVKLRRTSGPKAGDAGLADPDEPE